MARLPNRRAANVADCSQRGRKPPFLKIRSKLEFFRALLAKPVQGTALLEFAIVLPLLVVFVVGIYDFSGAFDQKQKIDQAAQEGAIVAGAQPMSDIQPSGSPTNPASLQPVVTAVINSLTESGVVNGTCGPPTASGPGTGPNALAWTYTILGCSAANLTDALVIVINRGWVSGSGSPVAVGSIVTITFPYHWTFNRVIQLLIPGAPYAATTYLTESATVHNQL
jgi:Flp pilus assembly protein TadG